MEQFIFKGWNQVDFMLKISDWYIRLKSFINISVYRCGLNTSMKFLLSIEKLNLQVYFVTLIYFDSFYLPSVGVTLKELKRILQIYIIVFPFLVRDQEYIVFICGKFFVTDVFRDVSLFLNNYISLTKLVSDTSFVIIKGVACNFIRS